MKTVFIIDRDLGFVFWLGQVLLAAGYEVIPAKGTSEATALIGELQPQVDLLIVNPSLAGAASLVAVLRRSRADLKVLLLTGDTERRIPFPDAILQKPLHADHFASSVWLQCVEQLIARKVSAAPRLN